jgi:glycosyltransferase involved in cell wall biosynthesis
MNGATGDDACVLASSRRDHPASEPPRTAVECSPATANAPRSGVSFIKTLNLRVADAISSVVGRARADLESVDINVIKVAAFTSGEYESPARFRVRQYIDPLRSHGIELSEFFTAPGAFPPRTMPIRPFWALASLASRAPSILRSHRHDVTLLQREMLSTFVTLEPLTKKPRILDVDDAIWLHRRGAFAARLAEICDSVICGNSFLADYFSKSCARITVLPTAVDTDRFQTLRHKPQTDVFTIGWSGGHSGFPDLRLVEKPLQVILRKNPKMRLRLISNEPASLDLNPNQVEFVKWSPEVEVQAIQTLDVGIMPLRDTPWSYGKCAYKMLLYMSCGLPVVVSPVGMNTEISKMAAIGATAPTADDWIAAIEDLSGNREKSVRLGQNGRDVVVQHFSRTVLAPRLASEILHVAGCSSSIQSSAVGAKESRL